MNKLEESPLERLLQMLEDARRVVEKYSILPINTSTAMSYHSELKIALGMVDPANRDKVTFDG